VSPLTPTGVPPSTPGLSMPFGFDDSTTGQSGRTDTEQPHNPVYATPAGYHAYTVWPLPISLATTLGITCCFLFLWVLRCFTSPRSLRHPMCSGGGDGTLLPPGFPIRISPDRSLVASSPALIAGSHVLLRLLVPRHPPCALNNLTTKMKMLASTVQFSRYGRDRYTLLRRRHRLLAPSSVHGRCDEGEPRA
jgi:hypothetical protein